MFKTLLSLMIIFLLVKLVWIVVQILWLAPSGVSHKDEVGGKPLYYRVKLSPNEAPVVKKTPVKTVIAGSIKDITLLAVYNSTDSTVVTIVYKKDSKILGRGDELNGFTLEGGGSNYAIFTKDSKNYRVDLVKNKKLDTSSGSIKLTSAPSSNAVKSDGTLNIVGEVTDAGDHKIIDKSLLTHYAKNMDDIYKDIGITEVKEGGKLKFKITFVRRGSPFAKLGVQRGDIFKSINGQEINSYNAAFEAYKNIGNVENVTLVIQRGKKEMELEYEVN
jgi:general secretion pathway protein C